MRAELKVPVSHAAYENLFNALAYERDSINAAYDLLLGLAHRGACSEGAIAQVIDVLQGLTGMLRFIFERVYSHTCETSITFLREIDTSGSEECGKAVTALHDAIVAKALSSVQQKKLDLARDGGGGEKPTSAVRPSRCVFAISSQYDLDDQKEIIAALTRRLNHTVVVLRRCDAAQEVDFALQLGCSLLISPSPPPALYSIAHATKEKVLHYAQSSLRDEEDDDDELNALVCALDCRARTSAVLAEETSLRSQNVSPTAIDFPGDGLRGAFGADQSHAVGDKNDCDGDVYRGSSEALLVESLKESGMRLIDQTFKRSRIDNSQMFVSDFVGTAEIQTQLSQVIQYQPEQLSEGEFAANTSCARRHVPDPSLWRFQISNSLRESKSELVKAIKHLGGHVDNSNTYNPQTTHLVVAEGLAERTEKYLSCCAAMKFIVSPSFVLDSAKRGKWLVDRLHEYDRNPLWRLSKSPITLPFTGWRVVLFTSTHSVGSGVVTVLKAGGCEDITLYVFGKAEVPPCVDVVHIKQATHLLVECQKLASTGRFLFPLWFPLELKRQDERFFSFELLFYLLCFSTAPFFNEEGKLLDTQQQLPLSCRLEFC